MNVLFIRNLMKANLTKKLLRKKLLNTLAITCSVLLLNPAIAAKNDYDQEITIKSQRQAADLKNKIASYLDNVSIRQGSISISADIVKVFSSVDKESGEKNDTYLAKGAPAIFEQQLEDGSVISLQADEITYHPMSNMITVSGNAVVKQAGSEVSGNEITYNTLSERLEAQSEGTQSVTTILQPTILSKKKADYDEAKAAKKLKNSTENVAEKEGE